MIALILTIIVLLALVVAVLYIPWSAGSGPDRDQLNKAFYQSRIAELEDDNAPASVEQRQSMLAELQHNLLEDIPASQQQADKPLSRWVLFPGVLALLVLSIGMFIKTNGVPRVLEWQASVDQTPLLMQRVMDPNAKPLTTEEMARLGLGLRTRLQQYPDNVESWIMLGRIGMVLNNATTATQAFEKAYTLDPQNGDAKIGLAEVLTRSADPEDNQQGAVLLREMLKADHTNVRVLSLLAFNAFEQQQYQEAIGAWQVMLQLLPQNDERRAVIERSIEQAKVAAGVDSVKLPVTITLSPQAERQLPANGVLFISVADGVSSVPVAARKIALGHFPLTITLDDSNAMMQARLLSSLHSGVVRVHVSASGEPALQPGDWFGESAFSAIDPNTPVKVLVSNQQP